MRSYAIALFLLGFVISPAFAQTDSITVVKADWEKQRIAPGVRLKTFRFDNNLFGADQNVSILEIKVKKNLMFDLGYDAKKLIHTSEFGKSAGAIAALNGTFFNVSKGGSADFIKSDGVIINETTLGKKGGRGGSAVVLNKGKLSIVKGGENEGWERSLEGEDIMVSGPLLVLDQQEEKLDSNAFNKTRHPRTAIAVTKNNRVLFITVDGRNENSAGMSLFELASLARWLNADDAINLDGGGSTALWVNNYNENGIVNYPSDNKKWDHNGERKVANVILLKKR